MDIDREHSTGRRELSDDETRKLGASCRQVGARPSAGGGHAEQRARGNARADALSSRAVRSAVRADQVSDHDPILGDLMRDRIVPAH